MTKNILQNMPENGSLTQDFLTWEDDVITAFKTQTLQDPVWACWQSANGLCVTRKEHRLAGFKQAQQNFNSNGFEISTRRSGGTIVPQGGGILNITSIALQHGPRNIAQSYQIFCKQLQIWLGDLGFETDIGPVKGCYCDGDYNLILNGKKLAGTSQRWIKGPAHDPVRDPLTGSDENLSQSFIVLNHAVMLVTETGHAATRRVNDFRAQAERTQAESVDRSSLHMPYDENSAISLWEHNQTQSTKDKTEYFDRIMDSFKNKTLIQKL